MSLIKNLGHVGIICDDFMKMRDFYTRVMGLTVTDEDPDRGSCFLSASHSGTRSAVGNSCWTS